MKEQHTIFTRGYFTLLTLVFVAVFLTLLSALVGFIFAEKRIQSVKEAREQALHIAEAGLEYYRWFLAHNPEDLTDGTGAPGPYAHDFLDPEGGVLGTFSLDVGGDSFCGQVTSVFIESTGWTAAYPQYKRTVTARYTRPSVADYSHIVNSNVWAGADRVITGPYHSNQGVRMDGTHNADVSSGVSTWLCTGTFGCSPSQNQNGVFGAGSNPELWRYPVPPINFGGITVDLASLQNYATSSGVYLPPSGNYGYRITMNADGTLTARRVTGATQVWGYSIENGWLQERSVIATTDAPVTYAIPSECPVVFIEDDIWLDGTVSGKVTLAAADVDTANTDHSIVLNGNITYAGSENDGLTAIGENNVLVGLETPDVMTIRGIFIAQLGHFSRNHYCADNCSGSTSGDTGLKTASTANVATGWSNLTVTRLSASDNSKASCNSTCDDNDDGQISDFSFTVPSGATISGIEVRAEMSEGSSSGNIGTRFSLSWNNGTSFTSTKSATVDGTGDANYTLGGSSDTWGRTWSDTDFANGAFRVRIDKLSDSDTLSIDQVQVRVYYTTGNGLPSSLDPYVTRSTLNTIGTVVSNGRVGTKWTSGGVFVSGYSQRNDTYDLDLSKSPPPFTPATSDDFLFVDWREQN